MGAQLWVQVQSVLLTMAWSAVVSLAAFKVAGLLVGLRVSPDDERQGLDTTAHGETAYTR